MRKTYKYRLLGNNIVFNKLDHWLYLCRWLYNTALEQRILIYRQNKGYISCYDQINQLPELKKAFPEYKDIGSHTLQEVMERIDRAYKGFYRRAKKKEVKVGYPRFKGKNRYRSIILKNKGWKLEGKYLFITKVGKFKLRLSRPIEGNIKTISICKSKTDKWYACFNCDNTPTRELVKLDTVVGIDVGIKSFLVDSDGNKIDNPQYLRKSENLIKIKQKMLSRRHKGSNRRNDARILFSKASEKVSRQRNDFLHKLANQYIYSYGTLVFEDLNIKGMSKNHHISKSLSDTGWGKFYELCSYKAEEAGRTIIRIPRFEPTSKTCSNCGNINQDLTLNDRQWVCKSCGVLHDRDYNAAKNIKRVGQTQQALTCANRQSVACESTRFTKSGVSMTQGSGSK